jgi:hypothetical protein
MLSRSAPASSSSPFEGDAAAHSFPFVWPGDLAAVDGLAGGDTVEFVFWRFFVLLPLPLALTVLGFLLGFFPPPPLLTLLGTFSGVCLALLRGFEAPPSESSPPSAITNKTKQKQQILTQHPSILNFIVSLPHHGFTQHIALPLLGCGDWRFDCTRLNCSEGCCRAVWHGTVSYDKHLAVGFLPHLH